ncbi:MAG: DHA2 family efflux MFS transporter permease subunit, partial [Verrucomicrobia bacterium]|nr:DHA2 family efflux MFS transporter permease subunit [Verrucomicrobiota bacterium]
LFRLLQGVFGAALVPLSQTVMLDIYPPAQRGSAMAIWGMGVMLGPIMGPTLGGWLTDNYSWRWVFYINLPIGVLAIILCFLFLEDPPYLKESGVAKIDFIGFGLLAVWIGCLQVMLDKGQDADWFSSSFIRTLAICATLGFIAFLIWELRIPNPIVKIRVLLDRNLAIGSMLLFLIGAILYGTTAVLPLFLQNLLSYPSLQAGLVMSPRGFGAIAGSIVSGRILASRKLDGRIWIALAFILLGFSMYILGDFTTQIAPGDVVLPIVMSGFAVTCIFVPMTTYSMATVPRQSIGDATGITSLLRNLGGSVGISLITAFVARGAQAHQALMVGHLSPENPAYVQQLHDIQAGLTSSINSADAHSQAYGVLYETLLRQASLWSYVDQFRWLFLFCLCCVPLVFLFKKPVRRPGPAEVASH